MVLKTAFNLIIWSLIECSWSLCILQLTLKENMNCTECGFEEKSQNKVSLSYGVPLCEFHEKNIKDILSKMDLNSDVGSFYYALKKIGLKPFIGWWNGQRHVPISFGRLRINIDFYDHKTQHNHADAFKKQENESYDHGKHFICLQIPLHFLSIQLKETAMLIYNLHEGLKNY